MNMSDLLVGIAARFHSKRQKLELGNSLWPECEQVGAKIGIIDFRRYPHQRGCYIAQKDIIWINNGIQQKWNRDNVIAHEMIHWTGHPSRLNRETVTMHISGKYNNAVKGRLYAVEEVVAELGAVGLCCQLGLPVNLEHSKWYIEYWLQRCAVFENMEEYFFKVSNQAVYFITKQILHNHEIRLIEAGKMQEWLEF